MEDENNKVEELIFSIMGSSIDDIKRLSDDINSFSMYPVPDCFEGLEFFDIRYSVGSDWDHNIPGGLVKWCLKNLDQLYQKVFK